MRPFRFLLAAALAASISCLLACGARLEADPILDASSLLAGRYQLLVRTDSPALDKLVYESALRRLGGIMPLAEAEPYTGAVELSFVSSTGYAPLGLGVGAGRSKGGWYSGHGTALSLGLSTFGNLSWQNSVMTVVVKGAAGERLWSATCRHRGSLGFGASGDAAGARAAETCLEELAGSLGSSLRPAEPTQKAQ
jgi:hypothetical protein